MSSEPTGAQLSGPPGLHITDDLKEFFKVISQVAYGALRPSLRKRLEPGLQARGTGCDPPDGSGMPDRGSRGEHERLDDNRDNARGIKQLADVDEVEFADNDAVYGHDRVTQVADFKAMQADKAADIAVGNEHQWSTPRQHGVEALDRPTAKIIETPISC